MIGGRWTRLPPSRPLLTNANEHVQTNLRPWLSPSAALPPWPAAPQHSAQSPGQRHVLPPDAARLGVAPPCPGPLAAKLSLRPPNPRGAARVFDAHVEAGSFAARQRSPTIPRRPSLCAALPPARHLHECVAPMCHLRWPKLLALERLEATDATCEIWGKKSIQVNQHTVANTIFMSSPRLSRNWRSSSLWTSTRSLRSQTSGKAFAGSQRQLPEGQQRITCEADTAPSACGV